MIEHVFNPTDLLTRCSELLKVGWRIWLETPNNESFGHKLYQADWRGLEPPRHLAIFSSTGLAIVAKKAGLQISRKITRDVADTIFKSSSQICAKRTAVVYGRDSDKRAHERGLMENIYWARRALRHNPEGSEFLTVELKRVLPVTAENF